MRVRLISKDVLGRSSDVVSLVVIEPASRMPIERKITLQYAPPSTRQGSLLSLREYLLICREDPLEKARPRIDLFTAT